MINPPKQQTIIELHQAGHSGRKISQLLNLSRNTVKKALAEPEPPERLAKSSQGETHHALIQTLFHRCQGNVVRVQELLASEHDISMAYSTLTRYIKDSGLRKPPTRYGEYEFTPGLEMQHDTSPHTIQIGTQRIKAQCAAIVLAYSRRLYMQYYPRFTRFEAKAFLQQALKHFDGSGQRCVVDNTSVILASGSGSDAIIATEMDSFARLYGFQFMAHAVGHANRKGRIERPFFYIETNFLVGRTFTDWQDLNQQALDWCDNMANQKPKRCLDNQSPHTVFISEKPTLQSLPKVHPPVYLHYQRQVDSQGYINAETNRYTAPEKLIGKTLDIYQFLETIHLYYQHQLIAEHPRLIGKRYARHSIKGHHLQKHRYQTQQRTNEAEQLLRKHHPVLDEYIGELKKHLKGRGVKALKRLLLLKQTYPNDAFMAAIVKAHHYGLYELPRLETLILKLIAGDYFDLNKEDNP